MTFKDSKKRGIAIDFKKICLTGFDDAEEAEMKRKAGEAGYKVVSGVSMSLGALVKGGKEPGPKKLRLAREHNIKIATKEEFLALLSTGQSVEQLPDPAPPAEAFSLGDKIEYPPGVFVAIDFETADYGHDSACAIGVVRIENGKAVAEAHKLIRPPRRNVRHTRVHGLDWNLLENQPAFSEVWRGIGELLAGADFLIAHNACFDRSVLSASSAACGLAVSTPPFYCTLRGIKAALNCESYRLGDLCRELDIECEHHNALSDAKAAALLLEEAIKHVAPNVMLVEGIQAQPIKSPPEKIPSEEQDSLKEFKLIMAAINCDDILTPGEFGYICNWLREHDHLTETESFWPVFEAIGKILEDGIVTPQELDELKELTNILYTD